MENTGPVQTKTHVFDDRVEQFSSHSAIMSMFVWQTAATNSIFLPLGLSQEARAQLPSHTLVWHFQEWQACK